MVNKTLIITTTILFVVGCSGSGVTTKDSDRQKARGVVITYLAVNSAHGTGGKKPDDDDNASGECPICDGTGKVGDGVIFATCRTCDGTGKVKPRVEQPPALSGLPPDHSDPVGDADMSTITGTVREAEPTAAVVITEVVPTTDEIKILELENSQKAIIKMLDELKPSIDVITDAIKNSSTQKEKK